MLVLSIENLNSSLLFKLSNLSMSSGGRATE